MDATCAIQASIHVFSLVRKYVSRILGTYQLPGFFVYNSYICHMGCGEPFTVDSYTQKIQTELLKKYTFLLFPMS